MTDITTLPTTDTDNQTPIKETEDTNPDPRHQRRIRLMQALFSASFGQTVDLPSDELAYLEAIKVAIPDVDTEIKQHAPERPLAEVNQVDLAILRLIVFESKQTKTPTKVLINEAVELAKEFGTDGSSRFVNGVLGHLLATTTEPIETYE